MPLADANIIQFLDDAKKIFFFFNFFI
ncbi:hypothetical protein SCB49_06357 [unidentified eubacterium SCB49]|nr:hypothetical protein SCB49_06357 [unidentified eubacterium SCB49]